LKLIRRPLAKRLTWYTPEECDVIQFGGRAVSGLAALSDEFRLGNMPTMNEVINVRVVVRGLLRRRYGRWGYYRQFLEDAHAKVVLVWHDTLVESYLLADCTDIPVFIIQNGIRHDLSPTSGKGLISSLRAIKHLHPRVTTYFALGPPAVELLRPLVQGNFVCSGSFRLNEYVRVRSHHPQHATDEKRVGFVVSFPNRAEVPLATLHNNPTTFMRLDERDISYSDFYSIDGMVAAVLADVTRELDWELVIIGKRSDNVLETDYFSTVPGCEGVRIVPHDKGHGYAVADSFDALVTIDSTLGYEMLALGKRVGFVSNRLMHAGLDSSEMGFGQPVQLPADGPFWTSATTPRGIRNFLRTFLALSEDDWSLAYTTYAPRVTSCDIGNTLLRQAIREKIAIS